MTVRNLDKEAKKVGTLVDQLAQINGIQISSIYFDIFDKSPLQKEARAAAFKDASQKAKDYAQFSGRHLGILLVVDDFVRV